MKQLLFLIAALAIIGCAFGTPLTEDKSEFGYEAEVEKILFDVESELGDEAGVETIPSDVENEYGDDAGIETILSDVESEYGDEAGVEYDVENELGDEAGVEADVESEYGDEADIEFDVESELGNELEAGVDSYPPRTPPTRYTPRTPPPTLYTPPTRRYTPPTRYTPRTPPPTRPTRYTPRPPTRPPPTRYTPPRTPPTRYTPPRTPPTRYTPRVPPRSPRIPSSWCLSRLYIMAFTSGLRNAGSNRVHAVQVYARGHVRTLRLYNRPGNDYYPHKGDLWKINFSNFRFPYCIRIGDIRRISIVAASNDGWNIDSIVTLVGARGRYNVLTVNLHANRWIDGNGPRSHRRWDLRRY